MGKDSFCCNYSEGYPGFDGRWAGNKSFVSSRCSNLRKLPPPGLVLMGLMTLFVFRPKCSAGKSLA
jgi:hypothetical protein